MTDLAASFRDAAAATPRFEIRPLSGQDADAYRGLRQKILDLGDGRFFSDSYERERQLVTPERWQAWCTEKREHCIIGTFADNALVGAMMITQQGPGGSPVVEWEGTWLDPAYRRHKIGKAAYEQVLQWSRDHEYDYAVVFIRADNQRSQDIRREQGFAYAYTIPEETWADGSIAATHAFAMGLRAETAAGRRQIAIDRLEDILVFLGQSPHAPKVAERPVIAADAATLPRQPMDACRLSLA
jgi:GNAT superfamily N-acetyltransferase